MNVPNPARNGTSSKNIVFRPIFIGIPKINGYVKDICPRLHGVMHLPNA